MSEQTIQKKPVTVKKILLILLAILAAVVVALAIAVGCLWGNEIRTLLSFEKIADRNDDHLDGAVYQMTVSGGYYFDDYLAQGGAASDNAFIAFITDSLTRDSSTSAWRPRRSAAPPSPPRPRMAAAFLPETTTSARPIPVWSSPTPATAAMPPYPQWTCSFWALMWTRT